MSRHRIAMFATLTLAVVAVSSVLADGGIEIQTFPVAPDARLEAQYKNQNNWYRQADGSIDLKLYQQYIAVKYLETQRLLEKICSIHDINGCQPYRLRAQNDLKKFFKALGGTVKFFDTFLVKYRKQRAQRRHRHHRLPTTKRSHRESTGRHHTRYPLYTRKSPSYVTEVPDIFTITVNLTSDPLEDPDNQVSSSTSKPAPSVSNLPVEPNTEGPFAFPFPAIDPFQPISPIQPAPIDPFQPINPLPIEPVSTIQPTPINPIQPVQPVGPIQPPAPFPIPYPAIDPFLPINPILPFSIKPAPIPSVQPIQPPEPSNGQPQFAGYNN